MIRFLGLACAALLLSAGGATAQHQHGAGAGQCMEPSLACAVSATPSFAPDGSLWIVWSAGGQVSVARSSDLGRSFGPAVAVSPGRARIDTGADARPKIVVDPGGRIVVTYTVIKDDAYNGEVFFTRSIDGGASFAPPRPITDDTTSQRFETLAIDPAGSVVAAWLDKRPRVAAKAAGKDYIGAALAYAWSNDGGESFTTTRLAQDNTCECCRLGIAFAGPARPVILWRNVFNGTVRDHAVTTFVDRQTAGPIYRVSVDEWATDACPHHGPSLAVSADGVYHAAWFTEGSVRQGLFYARSTDGGRSFSAPLPVGDPSRQASRPQLYAATDGLWLAWKEFDGEHTTVAAMISRDGGASWSAPHVVGQTTDASDHPLLIGNGRSTFLSWLTRKEGYRLFRLGAAS